MPDRMKLKVGQKVFAKVRGYPTWPARIVEITKENTNNPRCVVFFYGSEDTANCRFKDIHPFIENINKFGKPRKLKSFNTALEKIMDDLTCEERRLLLLKKPHVFVKRFLHDEGNLPRDASRSSASRPDTTRNSVPYAAFEFGNECVVIPNEPTRVAYHKIEGRVVDIDFAIRKCLRLELTEPDLITCINLLDEFLELRITPLMVTKTPDVVETIRRIRRYGRSPPSAASPEEKELFLSRVREIRERADKIVLKFKNLFPDSYQRRSFFDYYADKYNDLYETKIRHMSMQQFVDWVDM